MKTEGTEMNNARTPRILLATAAIAGASLAAAIDTWEPVKNGTSIPTAAQQANHTTSEHWIGYSDGRVYAKLSSNSWMRLDSAVNPGGTVVNVAPNLPVTAIATVKNYDGLTGYVAFMGNKYQGKLWKVGCNKGTTSWRDLGITEAWNVSANQINGTVYVTSSIGVRYSTDGGATFTTTAPANDPYRPAGATGAVAAVATKPGTETVVVGMTSGEVWIGFGVAAGKVPSWHKVSTVQGKAALPERMVTGIAIDSRDASGKTFYAAFGDGAGRALWATRNGGQSWYAIGDEGLAFASVAVPAAPTATSLYATTSWEMYRSDDNGTTWFRTPRWSGRNIALEYRSHDTSALVRPIKHSIRFKNMGSVPVRLNHALLSYRYTHEGVANSTYYPLYQPSGYYVSATIANLGTERRVNITVDSDVQIPVGGTSPEIVGALGKLDNSYFGQYNDFSFVEDPNWTYNPYFPMFIGGTQVWGFARR